MIEITAPIIAAMGLAECRRHLSQANAQNRELALAAHSAHQALQAALTAALEGPRSIGAMDPKLAARWDEALRGERAWPASDRVMGLPDLLEKATSEPLPWSGHPLPIDEADRKLIKGLEYARHAVEHPKQGYHVFQADRLAKPIPVAAKLAVEALETIAHQLEPGELDQLRALVGEIAQACEPWIAPDIQTPAGS